MIYKLYTIRDSKVEAYLPPILARSKGEALRRVENSLKEQDSQFAKTPEDYTLFELGEWDDSTSEYNLHAKAQSVAGLWELASKDNVTQIGKAN